MELNDIIAAVKKDAIEFGRDADIELSDGTLNITLRQDGEEDINCHINLVDEFTAAVLESKSTGEFDSIPDAFWGMLDEFTAE